MHLNKCKLHIQISMIGSLEPIIIQFVRDIGITHTNRISQHKTRDTRVIKNKN
jgi:hypothetical protein